jgi:hypothetical protein
MMTRTAHVSLIAAISLGRCPGRVKGVTRSLPVIGLIVRTWERRRIHEGSPPAASTRGLITSGGLSSGAMRMTLPFMPGEPSGMGRPVVTREARSRAKRDLPRPGSPSRMVNLPRMIRPGQSQWSDCVSKSERGVPSSSKVIVSGSLCISWLIWVVLLLICSWEGWFCGLSVVMG